MIETPTPNMDKTLPTLSMPTDDEMLRVLQYLATQKIARYSLKWSKSSEDHIARLDRDFNDIKGLVQYFTKR